MKYILRVTIILLLSSFPAFGASITYSDKSTGGEFTAADANEIKTVVNGKQDRVTGTCPEGEAIATVNSNGTVVCESVVSAGDDLGDAAASDVSALFTGSTGYLNADGTISTPSGTMVYPDEGIPVSTGSAWGTSYSLSSLTLALPQVDLLTVLEGSDLGVASLSVDPASSPSISGADSDSGDENKTIWNIYGDATTTTAGAVVSDLFFQHKDGGDASGVLTTFAWMDGSVGTFYFEVPVALTSILSAGVPTSTGSATHTLSSIEYHGGTVFAPEAGIYTLPAAAANLSGCVEATYGVTAIIQLLPASGDFIVYKGARGTVATSLKSGGDIGDKICYIAHNDSEWYVSAYGDWAE